MVAGELELWVRERTPERAAVPVEIVLIDPLPLTGVGKVFKPQLRWNAAQRVFSRTLALTPQATLNRLLLIPQRRSCITTNAQCALPRGRPAPESSTPG